MQLLREFGGPIAAPSANRSNRVSPTTADHVRGELGNAVDLILDGGPCRVGIESTVLDLSSRSPTILRPGGISQQQIEEMIGPVTVFSGSLTKDVSASSPGQQEVHYAPHIPAFRFTSEQAAMLKDRLAQVPPTHAALIWFGGIDLDPKAFHRVWRMSKSAPHYAQALYSVLREADGSGAQEIWLQMPPERPQWAAARDRLIRATKPLT
jgi:L-threonylcarbamoyladenylate synthase